MCCKALIRSLTSSKNEPTPQSIDLEGCLCCLNYDYNFLSYVFLMNSKWKYLSQEEVVFLPLIPSDTLNILIDMKLIFRRQESSEVFVTMTIVTGAIKDCQLRAENRLFSFYSVPRVYDFAMLSWFTHSQERTFLLYEALLPA